jgi:hypothetical protein
MLFVSSGGIAKPLVGRNAPVGGITDGRSEAMRAQHYINLASALIVLVGGMIMVMLFPAQMDRSWRVIVAVMVVFYSAFRVGQVVLAVQRERRERESELTHLTEDNRGDGERKTP